MSLTILEFEAMIGSSYELDKEIDRIEKETLGPLKAQLKELDQKILNQLDASGVSSFKSRFGTVVRSNRYTVSVPKNAEDKAKFFEWLSARGEDVYWKYTTVNSQALNSLYKAEMEVAKDEGNIDFKIPGLPAPELRVVLSRRSK